MTPDYRPYSQTGKRTEINSEEIMKLWENRR